MKIHTIDVNFVVKTNKIICLKNEQNRLAEDCAANVVSLDEIKKWFQIHKTKLK